jgi:hypothetical protein
MNLRRRSVILGIVALAAIVFAASFLYVFHISQPCSAVAPGPANSLSDGSTATSTEVPLIYVTTAAPQTSLAITTQSGAAESLLKSQLQCTQMEKALIIEFINNFDSQPVGFSSQSHFDTTLNKCFVLLQYDQFNGLNNSHVQALYDATNKILLECYAPPVSVPPVYRRYQTTCNNWEQLEYTTTKYNQLTDRYMTE